MKPVTKSSPDGATLRRTSVLLVAFLSLILTASGEVSRADASSSASPARRLANLLKDSPKIDSGFERFSREATDLLQEAEIWAAQLKAERKRIRETIGLNNLPQAELHGYFHDPTDCLSPRELRGLKQLVRLARCAADASSAAERASCLADLSEVRIALRNNRRRSLPEVIGLVFHWKLFFEYLHRDIGRGSSPATNVLTHTAGESDAAGLNPADSTFWTRPTDIAAQDLYAGFGRKQMPTISDSLCDYDGPKNSAGTTPGFDIVCGSERYKLKFQEFNSEPFTARLFHALGYHVDPTDYAPRVKIRYDRRMFREFNQRKPLKMRFTFFGIPVGSVNFQEQYDPFDFIVLAVFKDGQTVTGAKLKERLFHNPADVHPENDPHNFRPEVESSLDHLILSPANVQPGDVPAESVGCWEFGGLGHEQRRELRAAGLLAAWLAWSDSRFDNTQLRFIRDNGRIRFEHFFTDLGGGLGEGTGAISRRGEDPDLLTWSFTRPEIRRGPGRMTTPFRIVHFQTLVQTPAFRAMTVEDARWMARLIGQLTETQLSEALIASGYDSAASRLYLEKLVGRRDQMILDLGLKEEIPLLRPDGVDRHLSFNPSMSGPFKTALPSGTVVQSSITQSRVVDGKLVTK